MLLGAVLLVAGSITALLWPRGEGLGAPPSTAAGACTRDLRPTADLGGLVAGLRPGDVACLAPGTYGARGTRTDWELSGERGRPVTLRAARPGTALLLGMVHLAGSHLVLDGVVLDGPTGPVTEANSPAGEEVLLWAEGDDLVVRRTEVRHGLWRAGVYVEGERVLLDGLWVHDNGPWSDPRQEQVGGRADNIDQGVYWGRGSSGWLRNSVLERNLAYGLQISGGAGPVHVAHNTVVRNGRGGVIWAEDTSGSTLVNNVIAYNEGYGLNAHLLTGSDNRAHHNLGWGNARGEWNDTGPVRVHDNAVGDPGFAGMRDYRLGPDSAALDAASEGAQTPRDRDGVRRPQGRGPDIGAYERPATSPARSRSGVSPTGAARST